MDSGRSWLNAGKAMPASASASAPKILRLPLEIGKRHRLFDTGLRLLARATGEQDKDADHDHQGDDDRDDEARHENLCADARRCCPTPGRCIAPPSTMQSPAPDQALDAAGMPPPAGRTWDGGPIVLVGLMGAGKSTVGRRLALRLHLPFVDADNEIEAAAGMPIAEIFARFGEPYFRDGERRVIARLIDGQPKVIATGGGAFVHADTRALILGEATAVWLDADLDVLVDRVRRRDSRPLLKGRDPQAVLADLASVRNPLYAQAHIRVASNRAPHDVTVDAILKAIGR